MQTSNETKKLITQKGQEIASEINSDANIYKVLQKNNLIYQIVSKNILEEDFKRTRRAGICLFTIPMCVNIGFILTKRNRYLRNLLSFSSLLGCYSVFTSNLRTDAIHFVKKDNIYSNMMRQNMNEIEILRLDSVDQSEKIMEIADMRKRTRG